MEVEEETGGGGPRCPVCSSEGVAIRGSQSIRTAPPLQAWECKKCGLVFAYPARDIAVTRLLLDFDAFFLEHRRCGELDGGATDERAWLACVACGARIERPMEILQ
jgi:hypothetical protein